MDFKQIQELIKLINKSNIGEVTIEEKGFKITVKQKEEHIQQIIASPFQSNQSAPVLFSTCCFGTRLQFPGRKWQIKTGGTCC